MTAEPAEESVVEATEAIWTLIVADAAAPLKEMARVLEREHDVLTTTITETTDVLTNLDDGVDCVIGSSHLTESDGLDALEAVRSARPEVPITVFYDDETTAAHALRAGGDHCIRYDEGRPTAQAAHLAITLRQHLQRKRTECALRNETAFVRGALNALDDAFFVFNLDGEFIHWNESVTAVTGYTDDEVAGMTPTDFVAETDTEAIIAAIDRTVSEGRAKAEADLATKSGEHIPYEFTGALLEDDSGTLIGICGIARDVTDRKRRERALSHHAERLRTTNRINEIIRDVNRALVRASTREEIERAVCENLAGEDAYRFAWIGEQRVAKGDVEARMWAGVEEGYLDARPSVEERSAADVTAETAIETGEMQVAQSIAENPSFESWREAALSRGYESAAAIPLVYHETTYGVLCVYSPRPNAFDDTEREVLQELGKTIAYAFSAAERRRALVSDSVVELEFALHDRSIFTIDLTVRTGCRVTLDGIIERSDGALVEFVTITGTGPETVLDLAADRDDIDASLVNEHEGESVFQFVSEGLSSTTSLADRGGVVREGVAENGEGRIVFELPRDTDVRTIVEAISERYADTELIAQRERERTSTHGTEFRAALNDVLTDRQEEVLKTAYLAGFFEWPHENTGDEIAASLGISGPTFHEHIRTSQRKLLESFFENNAASEGVRNVE